MSHKQKTRTYLAGALSASALVPVLHISETAAQDGTKQKPFEEIVVTATRSGETRLQDTPIAVSVISDSYLTKSVTSDIRDLTLVTPGLTISQNADFAQVYIRGIGSNNIFAGSDPSSTMHQDGVYLARPVSGFGNFLDVERIEVLRGPQGTLYGRNSVGGTINIVSKRPSLDEVSGKILGTAGNSDFWRLDGYVTGPISEGRVGVSLAGQISKRDPYRENIVPTGNDVDDEDSHSLRGQLLWQASDTVEVLLRGDYFSDDSSLYAGNTLVQAPGYPSPLAESIVGDFGKVALNAPSTSDRENYGFSMEVNVDLGANWTMKSLTSYRDSSYFAAADPDGTEVDVARTLVWEEQDQFSQELNFIGSYDRFNIFFGLFYFEEDIDSTIEVQSRAAGISVKFDPVVKTDSWAVFGQMQYHLTDEISVTLGGRYTEETKHWDRPYRLFLTGTDTVVSDLTLPPETGNYNNFTPKIGLEYKPNDDTLIYANVSKGFKSGGFNITGATSGGYDPETLWAYELGLKNTFADGRILSSLSAFYYDYKDLQVMAFIIPGTADITNAASAEVTGIEAELSGQVTEDFVIRATLAYLDAEYKSYPEAPLSGAGTVDASGNKLNNAPEWSASILGEYSVDMPWGTLRFTGEYGYQSKVYFTTTNSALLSEGGHGVLNASIGYETTDGQFTAMLWARNITDEEYFTSMGSIVNPTGTAGAPQTYGIRLGVNF